MNKKLSLFIFFLFITSFINAQTTKSQVTESHSSSGSSISTPISVPNGGTGDSTATDNTVLLGDGTSWTRAALNNCVDTGGQHLNYTAATHLFSCGTSGGSGALALNTVQTPDSLFISVDPLSNTVVEAEAADNAFDFAHPLAIDPTHCIHSHNQSTSQYICFVHNGTQGVIAVGLDGNGRLLVPGGEYPNPGLEFQKNDGTADGTGVSYSSDAGYYWFLQGSRIALWTGYVVNYGPLMSMGWTSGAPGDTSMDISFARLGPGVVGLRTSQYNTGTGALAIPAITPAQITSNTNDYAPTIGGNLRLSTDTSRNLTGIVAGQDGEQRQIWNVGSTDLVLVHQSASSSAINRFLTTTGADVTIAANEMAFLIYDSTVTRWRVAKP